MVREHEKRRRESSLFSLKDRRHGGCLLLPHAKQMITEDQLRLSWVVHSKKKRNYGYTLQKWKMKLDARIKKFCGEDGQTLETGPERCGISVLGSCENSVWWGWASSSNFTSASTFTVKSSLRKYWTPEGPFQPKPLHDEFNCSLY